MTYIYNNKVKRNSRHGSRAAMLAAICMLLWLPLSMTTAKAQSWAKKMTQGVITIKTFAEDGQLLGSANGIFIDEQGTAIVTYSPLKGASRAVVIDAKGKEWAVESVIGANDMYDVAKIQTAAKKTTAIPLSATTAMTNAAVWLLPYKTGKTQPGKVSGAEKFRETYDYYTLDMTAMEQYTGCPVMNDNGEAIGLMQTAAGEQKQTAYAVDVRYAANMKMTGLSMNEPALQATHLAKALPADYHEAMLALYVAVSMMSDEEYADYLERFINAWPDKTDGYTQRARREMGRGNIDAAESDLRHAITLAGENSETTLLRQLLSDCMLARNDTKGALAQLDSALTHFSRPYNITVMPILQQHARLAMECKRYQHAINDMRDLVAIEPHNAELWAEKASYEIRVKLTDDALYSALQCINIAPDNSDGYLMAGIAQCMAGNKTEGMANLQKAHEMGNPQAQTFIDKYKD